MINELSDKQKYSLTNSDARINIWTGAVRSGKSFSALLRFIEFCLSDIQGDMVLIGKTSEALKRNVISEIQRLLGKSARYSSGKGELLIYNRTVHVIGANDDRAEGKIRGSTFAGALVDEGTLIPEIFFKMLLSRLSVEGAKLFTTTNPDSPFHWLKKDFIDRKEELDCKVFPFELEDNPSLGRAYKDNLRKEYQGLYYDRFILGLWVVAQGAVYSLFDKEQHVINFPPAQADKYIVGVDYGTTNPTAFTLIGYNANVYPNMWIEKEYCWDSRKELRQKTDCEYAQDLTAFIRNLNIETIYIDPSAASFIQECRQQGMNKIQPANNSVLDGIRFVTSLLDNGTLKICSSCLNTIREFQSYVWDDKATLKGEDKPMKTNDHNLDSLRYACMHFFNGTGSMTPQDLNTRYRKALGLDDSMPAFFRSY